MEGRWTLLPFLGAYLVLLGLITGQGIYTNTWAIHIEGGAEEAERIAHKHGFISHGQVFGDYYHFQHRGVVRRSLSGHRGVHVRLHTEPQSPTHPSINQEMVRFHPTDTEIKKTVQ
uniref:Furin (paired basic amino acid cleaving enzyme) b n=1 Tax=Cyprinus carpio carpio TaxID=630221 RepID=A0A9J8A126_CYPCA